MSGRAFVLSLVFLAACSGGETERAPQGPAEPTAEAVIAGTVVDPLADENALPAGPVTGPSFDCGRASTEVELEICANKDLGRLDGEVARAYREARARLQGDRAALLALREDQHNWLSGREWADMPGAGMGLFAYLTERVADLQSVDAPRTAIGGRWTNLLGVVEINGEEVSASTVEPTRSVWICQLEGKALRSGETLTLSTEDTEGWTVVIQRNGSVVSVKETPPPDEPNAVRPYCGHNGQLAGDYLPAKQ
jgi:uncharacterized protein